MQNVPPVFLFFIGLLFAGACFCFSALVVNGMGKSGRFMMICATGILAGAWLPFDNIPLIIESIVRGPGLFFLGLGIFLNIFRG
ncbi:hypothetical protein LJC15_05195 [Desulfovibrio sp. OttesenSCG-928-G11]|nr:hypothetical protein [Desulfovibrio sp. OttesenSCG-928-G11]